MSTFLKPKPVKGPLPRDGWTQPQGEARSKADYPELVKALARRPEALPATLKTVRY